MEGGHVWGNSGDMIGKPVPVEGEEQGYVDWHDDQTSPVRSSEPRDQLGVTCMRENGGTDLG